MYSVESIHLIAGIAKPLSTTITNDTLHILFNTEHNLYANGFHSAKINLNQTWPYNHA